MQKKYYLRPPPQRVPSKVQSHPAGHTHSKSDYTEAQLKEKMCDYVRHEVSEMLKRGEEIKP